MDYELAALKLFCCELRGAKDEPGALSLFGIRFQRAWLQGVLVNGKGDGNGNGNVDGTGAVFLLDDGTDVVELRVPPSLAHSHNYWKPGMYVMVVGPCAGAGAPPRLSLVAHKMVDLSSHPHREAMWNLEVLEAHRIFYLNSNPNSHQIN